jgi:hypothetical protein
MYCTVYTIQYRYNRASRETPHGPTHMQPGTGTVDQSCPWRLNVSSEPKLELDLFPLRSAL